MSVPISVINVVIVEDDAGIRETLLQMLEGEPGFQCLETFADGENAMKAIPQLEPDVVLVDINLPGMSGIELIALLKEQTASQFLVLTVYDNSENIFQALAAGASGYLLKRGIPARLLSAIREVNEGGSPMSASIARQVVQSFHRSPESVAETQKLSPREAEILKLLADGLLYKEIADQLFISYETVRTHVRRIYEKLHVRTRTEAVVKYLRR